MPLLLGCFRNGPLTVSPLPLLSLTIYLFIRVGSVLPLLSPSLSLRSPPNHLLHTSLALLVPLTREINHKSPYAIFYSWVK